MLSPTKTDSPIFDRNDLRSLRSAFEQALRALSARCRLDEVERDHLACVVLDIGWAQACRGESLVGADAIIAALAVRFIEGHPAFALCA